MQELRLEGPRIEDLNISIFSNQVLISKDHIDLQNNVYQHWRWIWEEILDSGKETSSERFLSQHIYICLHMGSEAYGLITSSFFDLRKHASFDHPYIRVFPKSALDLYCRAGLVMTIEFLSVHPLLRKMNLGFSLGDVLLGLSQKLFAISPYEIVLGTARKKLHVDQMCQQFGFQSVGRLAKYGLDCEMILNRQDTVHLHPNEEVNRWVDFFWERKNDYAEFIYLEPLLTTERRTAI